MTLQAKSFALRKEILTMVYRAKSGHIGGDFSVVDILNVLYNAEMDVTPANRTAPVHDRLVLSKGHCVEALYCVLADKGFFPKADLETFSQFGSKLIGHPNNQVAGIEMNAGSLGHGLSVGVGMALAQRMDAIPSRTYVVMGDGELAEGSVWEGAMAASHYRLHNLCAVVDQNGLQISGTTDAVMSHGDLAARWRAFGWQVIPAKGNDTGALSEAFVAARREREKPVVILAKTVKGCGVSFMEGQAAWHHRVPTAAEYEKALEELTAKEVQAGGK